MVVVFGAIIKLLKVESLSTYLLNLLLELFYREAQKCFKGWMGIMCDVKFKWIND